MSPEDQFVPSFWLPNMSSRKVGGFYFCRFLGLLSLSKPFLPRFHTCLKCLTFYGVVLLTSPLLEGSGSYSLPSPPASSTVRGTYFPLPPLSLHPPDRLPTFTLSICGCRGREGVTYVICSLQIWTLVVPVSPFPTPFLWGVFSLLSWTHRLESSKSGGWRRRGVSSRRLFVVWWEVRSPFLFPQKRTFWSGSLSFGYMWLYPKFFTFPVGG